MTTITGIAKNLDGTPIVGAMGTLTPAVTPLFVNFGSGYAETEYESLPVGPSGNDGSWSITLAATGDVCDPLDPDWLLVTPGTGIVLKGPIPHSGTYTDKQLVDKATGVVRAWGLVSSPALNPDAVISGVAGPAGNNGPGNYQHNGSLVGTEEYLDFEDSATVTATVTDDAANGRVKVSFDAATASVPDASTTTKGVAKLSIAPVSPTAPIAVGDNDPRNTNARTPTAHKSTHATGGTDALAPSDIGALSATDPSVTNSRTPTAHATTHESGGTDVLSLDAAQIATGTIAAARLPTETGSTDTNSGHLVTANDTRLSDTRTPTDGSVTDAKITSGGLSPSKITGTAVITTDSRLSDSRTPTAHETTHLPGGTDALDLTKIQPSGASLPTLPNSLYPANILFVRTSDETVWQNQSGTWVEVGGSTSALTDATTSAIGGVEIDVAPTAGHPVALTAAGLTPAATSGAPASGTYVTGSLHLDNGHTLYVCTAGGTPGTWVTVNGGAGSSTLAGDTDVSLSSPANGDVLTYVTADGKWENKPLLSTATAILSSDVTLTSANTWYDLVALTLAAGTWELWGTVELYVSSGTTGDQCGLSIFDGSAYKTLSGFGGGTGSTVATGVVRVVVTPTVSTTYTLRVASSHAGYVAQTVPPYVLSSGMPSDATKLLAVRLA